MNRPFVLIIRDGWGANPHPDWNHANAVHLARTPVDGKLMADYPHVQIITHGRDVGLPDGVMGNSEVGHQNIGAGRIVDQEVMRISRRIEDGTFFANPALLGAFQRPAETGGCVHLMGLCSDAGVHSVLSHLFALLELARRVGFDGQRVFLHAFGDGRDCSPFSGIECIKAIEAKMSELGVGRVASVIGRYYAMDRDNRWDRVESAYLLLTEAKGTRVGSAVEAFARYYDNASESSRQGDEFVTPTIVVTEASAPAATIRDGDSVIFFNFRGDRPERVPHNAIDDVVRRVVAAEAPALSLVRLQIHRASLIPGFRRFEAGGHTLGFRLYQLRFLLPCLLSHDDHRHRGIARVNLQQALIDASEMLDRQVTVIDAEESCVALGLIWGTTELINYFREIRIGQHLGVEEFVP